MTSRHLGLLLLLAVACDGPDAVDAGTRVDAAPMDGATATDAMIADAGPSDGGSERLDAPATPDCLPGDFSGTWEGDARVSAACGPYLLGAATIRGRLVVDPGVVVHLTAQVTVEGGVDIGAGAELACVFDAATYGTFLVVAGTSVVRGTPDAPVLFTRTEVTGFNNACGLSFERADVDHANFQSTPPSFGGGSTIHDSIFDPSGNGGDRTFVTVAAGVVLEHNRFDEAELRGRGFTARLNHFDGEEHAGVWICALCGDGSDSCTGTRAVSADVVIEDNVFDTLPSDEVFTVGRTFGEVRGPGNHFPRGGPTRPDAWSGGTTGCAGDGLGAYGGPLVLTPVASTAPPSYGPRR